MGGKLISLEDISTKPLHNAGPAKIQQRNNVDQPPGDHLASASSCLRVRLIDAPESTGISKARPSIAAFR